MTNKDSLDYFLSNAIGIDLIKFYDDWHGVKISDEVKSLNSVLNNIIGKQTLDVAILIMQDCDPNLFDHFYWSELTSNTFGEKSK